MALKLSDDAYVLEDSAIIMQGKAQNLMRSEAAREAFSVCSSIAPALRQHVRQLIRHALHRWLQHRLY